MERTGNPGCVSTLTRNVGLVCEPRRQFGGPMPEVYGGNTGPTELQLSGQNHVDYAILGSGSPARRNRPAKRRAANSPRPTISRSSEASTDRSAIGLGGCRVSLLLSQNALALRVHNVALGTRWPGFHRGRRRPLLLRLLFWRSCRLLRWLR